MAPSPPWADLPEELLYKIATHLHKDAFAISAFRTVCKWWCFSARRLAISPHRLSPPFPLTIIAPPPSIRTYYKPTTRKALLSVTVICALRAPSQHPLSAPPIWIAFIDQLVKDKVRFRLPFSRFSFNLPFNFPRNINLWKFGAIELGRFYNIPEMEGEYVEKLESVRVIILSDMSAVVRICERGLLSVNRLGDIKDDQSIRQWEFVHNGAGFSFDDIIEFKGRVLGVDRRGRVYEIALDVPVTINQIVPPIAGGGGRRKRLVVSLEGLYLVVRCRNDHNSETQKFKVYKLLVNEETWKWGQVYHLGGMIFLFGIGFSLSFSSRELGGCYRENSIIFQDKSFRKYVGGKRADILWSKLGEKELRVGICPLGSRPHIRPIGSWPGCSESLWPPPSWIWPISRQDRLQEVVAAVDRILIRVPDRFKVGDPATFKGLKKGKRSVLVFYRAVDGLKEIVNKMKEFDEALTATDTDVSYAELLNQIKTWLSSVTIKHPFAHMLESFADQIDSSHNGDTRCLRERATTFNGLIMSLEESFSEVLRLYIEHVEELDDVECSEVKTFLF